MLYENLEKKFTMTNEQQKYCFVMDILHAQQLGI